MLAICCVESNIIVLAGALECLAYFDLILDISVIGRDAKIRRIYFLISRCKADGLAQL